MKEEKIKYYQEKTRGVFHILEYRRFWDYITNLQEENEELKAELQEANDSDTWWNNRYKAVERDYKNYKQRNKKAIEYINNLLNSDDIPLVDVILTTIKEKLGGDEE